MAQPPKISVVIPTRGRPEALTRCLDALRSQTVPVEIVVAEDRAGDGPATARNDGARRARANVVLFTDDDCVPDPSWAERLSAACPADGAAAGETVNAVPGDPFASASQLLTSGLQRASLSPAGTLGFAPTSNLAVSRALLARVPFEESFALAAGEDRAWCARAREAGASIRFEPRALVRHRQDLGLSGFWRQQFRYGRGAARFRRAGGTLAAGGQRRRLIAAGVRAGPKVGILCVLAQIAVAAGLVAEGIGGGVTRALASARR